MSFSSEVKEEIRKKCFTFKNRHSKIANGIEAEYRKEYLMAMFLDSGSVSNPEKFYHLEFVCGTKQEAEDLSAIIRSFDIIPKITERKSHYVVYLKDSEAISSMLSILSAHQSMMKFENVRILKEMRENIQRQVNCETANISKTVSASVRQIEDIELIRSKIGLSGLPENLQEIARLRLERPSASLKELSEELSEDIGRSGVSHRLRKLSRIADGLREACGAGPASSLILGGTCNDKQ